MRTFQRIPGDPFRVGSVSAMGTMNSCERRFWHQYRAETPRDHDWKAPGYFAFGSALHKILELTEHDVTRYNKELLRAVCNDKGIDWDTDGAKLHVCCVAFFAGIKPMEIIAIEEEVIHEDWVMYIDLVARDFPNPARANDKPWWYLIDNKQTGRKFDPLILTKLTADPQMMGYARIAAPIIAKRYGLAMDEFFGVRYREVEKPRHKPKKGGESHDEFVERIGSTLFREPQLSKCQFRDGMVIESLNAALKKGREFSCEADTVMNTRACADNGTTCAWYSQCYGKTYTQAKFDGLDDWDKI